MRCIRTATAIRRITTTSYLEEMLSIVSLWTRQQINNDVDKRLHCLVDQQIDKLEPEVSMWLEDLNVKPEVALEKALSIIESTLDHPAYTHAATRDELRAHAEYRLRSYLGLVGTT